MGAEGSATEANLSCSCWWYTYHVGAVIYSAKDLEGTILSYTTTTSPFFAVFLSGS